MKRIVAILLSLAPFALRAQEAAITMLPENVCTYGSKIDHLYYTIFYTTAAAAAVVMGALLYFCLRYRQRDGARAHYTHGNSWTALGVTGSLAAMVFLGIDVNTVRLSNSAARETQHMPDGGDVIHIQVAAQQFAWYFRYPGVDGKFGKNDFKKANTDNPFGVDRDDPTGKDDIQVEGVCCVPVDRPIVFEIRSKDVIHSFFLPNFRIKQDAIPGMKNHIWIQATRTGDFDIACTELCGMMHSQMGGMLKVRTDAEYQQWLKDHAD
jgi:cytochrome c oxidase subunit 2